MKQYKLHVRHSVDSSTLLGILVESRSLLTHSLALPNCKRHWVHRCIYRCARERIMNTEHWYKTPHFPSIQLGLDSYAVLMSDYSNTPSSSSPVIPHLLSTTRISKLPSSSSFSLTLSNPLLTIRPSTSLLAPSLFPSVRIRHHFAQSRTTCIRERGVGLAAVAMRIPCSRCQMAKRSLNHPLRLARAVYSVQRVRS